MFVDCSQWKPHMKFLSWLTYINHPISNPLVVHCLAHCSHLLQFFPNNNEKHRRNKQFCPHIAIVEGLIPCFLHWLVLWVIDIWKCFGLSNLNITSFCRRAILAAPNSAIFQKKYSSCVLRLEMSNKTSTKQSCNTSKWRWKEILFGGETYSHIHIWFVHFAVGQGSRTRVFPTTATQAISQANMMFQRHIHEFLTGHDRSLKGSLGHNLQQKLAW